MQSELFKSLDGRKAEEVQADIRNRHKQFVVDKYEQEKLLLEQKYARAKKNAFKEKGYKKLKTGREKSEYLKNRESDLDNALAADKKRAGERLNNIYSYLDKFFSFFFIGRAVKYPVVDIKAGVNTSVYGVFLGFQVDERKPNPFAPSAVKARFAISDSNRYMVLSCSGEQGALIQRIIGSHTLRRIIRTELWMIGQN